MSAPALEIKNLNAWYGESHVLHGINLSVNKGEVVCLLGRNGAGRTTTLRAILGLVTNRTGSIKVNGHDVMGMPTHQVARLGIGYCPEERGIFTSLTCEQNLMLPPKVGEGMAMEVDEIYQMFPNLYERRSSPVANFRVGSNRCYPLRAFCELVQIFCCLMKSQKDWRQ
jgi:branched-chain amino acid transport system ATP-binding protein